MKYVLIFIITAFLVGCGQKEAQQQQEAQETTSAAPRGSDLKQGMWCLFITPAG